MKRLYISPKIKLYSIVIENSYATGSSNIIFGGSNDSVQPDIEDWTNEGSTGADWEL